MIRHQLDRQFDLPAGSVRLTGTTDEKIRLVTEGTLKVIDMHALADYFRNTADAFATGEFFGKILRASCIICGYTGDRELRVIVDRAVRDILSIQREDGCISTCPDETQPNGTNGSDLWERKYILMGLLAYYELCGSPEALEGAVKLIRYTNGQVGRPPKTPITETGWAFGGMESSSILEPVMRVFHLTHDPAAMELGQYIVESGCCRRENIFEAIRNGKSPKDIGWNGVPEDSIAKAYEMMSCFEGLCEYYRATGDREALRTVRLFFDRVSDEEITLLGSGGADAPFNLGPGTGEQWNRTRYEQTNPAIDLMMETCVTVYWMRLCHQLLRLTGEVRYVDAMETSLYNAIFGALRPDGAFFEYFPRFNGMRNPKVNYSFHINGFDLSCCTANGPTGLGLAPYIAFTGTADGGLSVNLYENGQVKVPSGSGEIVFSLRSDYPRTGEATLTAVSTEGDTAESLRLSFRVPHFAGNFRLFGKDGTVIGVGQPGTYLCLTTAVHPGDMWHISFDIPLIKHPAPHGSDRAGDHFTAFTYGSVLLARDERDGENPFSPISDAAVASYDLLPPADRGFLKIRLHLQDGTSLILRDYMSAGNDWNHTSFASWIPIR